MTTSPTTPPMHQCFICLDEALPNTADDRGVIQKLCINQGHLAHPDCLKSWFDRSSTLTPLWDSGASGQQLRMEAKCPCCKACIREAISESEDAKVQELNALLTPRVGDENSNSNSNPLLLLGDEGAHWITADDNERQYTPFILSFDGDTNSTTTLSSEAEGRRLAFPNLTARDIDTLRDECDHMVDLGDGFTLLTGSEITTSNGGPFIALVDPDGQTLIVCDGDDELSDRNLIVVAQMDDSLQLIDATAINNQLTVQLPFSGNQIQIDVQQDSERGFDYIEQIRIYNYRAPSPEMMQFQFREDGQIDFDTNDLGPDDLDHLDHLDHLDIPVFNESIWNIDSYNQMLADSATTQEQLNELLETLTRNL